MRRIKVNDKVRLLRDIERLDRTIVDSVNPFVHTLYASAGLEGIAVETFMSNVVSRNNKILSSVWHAKVLCEGKIYTFRLTSLEVID